MLLCRCASVDPTVAREAIHAAEWLDKLHDESHFGVAIRRCGACGQLFLTIFTECIDWADSDDPQRWLAVPIIDAEATALRAADIGADENAILAALPGTRRFLEHDRPKGTPPSLSWVTRPLYIAAHD